MILAAVDVTVGAGIKTLLRAARADFAAGRVTALLGPNGAGKSTLLRALAGLVTPTEGHVALDGRDLRSFPAEALALRRAWLPQETALPFPFLAYEVADLGYQARPGAPGRLRAALRSLRDAGADGLARRAYGTLSGGEKQRVQFARVLNQGRSGFGDAPGFYLLDEPTAALDLRHQRLFLERCRRLADAGHGVVAALHDLNLAARWADDAVLLQDGVIRGRGPIGEVLRTNLLRDIFDTDLIAELGPDGVPRVHLR